MPIRWIINILGKMWISHAHNWLVVPQRGENYAPKRRVVDLMVMVIVEGPNSYNSRSQAIAI